MAASRAYVRIDGEPYLSRVKAYRDAYLTWGEAWTAFAKSYGADGFASHGGGLNFSRGKSPDGWLKPQGASHFSRPKKGHPDVQILAAFREQHPRPKTSDVFGDDLCFNLSYDLPGDGHGHSLIGGFWDGAIIGWAGDTYTAIIPDPHGAIASLLESYPSAVPREPAVSWKLPDGLTRITQAEDELIYAQAKVDEERAKSAA